MSPDMNAMRASILAAADRQHALVSATLGDLVGKAEAMLAQHDEISAWAILATDIARQLDLDSKHRQFAGELLSWAAIDLAKSKARS